MRGLLRARYAPFGRTLLLETDSAAVLALADGTFGRFGPAARGQTPARPEITVRLLAGELPPSAPSPLERPADFRAHVLLFRFLSQLREHGLMAVHGSALVRHGQAVLLRGPGGAGKTTLAYAGARSRFQALAEDVVWVDVETGLWHGMPWLFHLLPDAARLFPELAGRPAVFQSADKMKLEVELESVRPGSTVPCARPGPVVLLERVARVESRLEPLAPAAALAAWKRSPAGLEEEFPGYESHAAKLLAAPGGAWLLRLGSGLDEALDLLESLLP